MWEKAAEYGIAYTEKPPYEVLFTNWITYDEILKLKQVEEMVEMYYNSNQFTYTLSMLEQEFESPFKLYEALAVYYEEKGYALQNPARSYRYQILLDFCMEKAPDKEDMYRELLTFDIYLREKMKTRPSFTKSQDSLKEVSREIYQREEETRELLPAYAEYAASEADTWEAIIYNDSDDGVPWVFAVNTKDDPTRAIEMTPLPEILQDIRERVRKATDVLQARISLQGVRNPINSYYFGFSMDESEIYYLHIIPAHPLTDERLEAHKITVELGNFAYLFGPMVSFTPRADGKNVLKA